MAYTKIIVIRGRLDKCLSYAANEEKTYLKTAVDYALDRGKTERVCYETAINCGRDTAYQDMMQTARRWGKQNRVRKGYHVIQSFRPGEVTPEQAHTIGVELAQRLLGGRYEVVVATHLDRAHLHNHVVFNAVSFVDGKMYRDTFRDYYEGIRGVSDALCREHGLSIIEPSEAAVPQGQYQAQRHGRTNLRDVVRRDVDEAIRRSYSYADFFREMRRMGYQVKSGANVKHTAVRPPDGQRFIRLDSLGEDYTEEAILQRLRRQRGVTAAMPPEQSESKRYTIRKRPRRYPPVKRGSFRALYLYYLYLLSPRKKRPQKVSFETRAEIRRAKQYRQQFMLLQKYHIDTKPELEMLSDALSNEMQILVDRRKELYALRREQPSEPLNADIDALTAQLRPLRRELRLCGKIVEYAPRMLRQVQESTLPSTENHLPNKAKERRHSLWR